MAGPIDTVSVVKTTWSWKQWPSWAPTVVYSYTSDSVAATHALRAPATVRNPRRPDGTRPMSGWWKQWFRGVTPHYSWKIRNKPSLNSWCFDFTAMPAISVLPAATHPGLYWEYVQNRYPFKPRLAFMADQVARTNVLGKIAQKKWDLGVTALELKQTAGLVTDLATGIVTTSLDLINSRRKMREKLDRLFRDVRRQGDFYTAARNVGLKDLTLLEDLRNKWMQYQFGIRPLISDIDNAVTWLSDAIHQSGYSVLVKAKAGHETRDDYLLSQDVGTPHSSMQARLQVRDVCQVHYSVVYEIPTGSVPIYTSLGLDNAPAIFWEATRLSWMVDYAFGIGDLLQSFTAANGMVFREGCVSTLRRLTGTALHGKPMYDLAPGGTATFDKGVPSQDFYVERGDFTRTLLTSGVTPAFVPQIKSKLGLVQLANSLFAMSSVLGGKPGLR